MQRIGRIYQIVDLRIAIADCAELEEENRKQWRSDWRCHTTHAFTLISRQCLLKDFQITGFAEKSNHLEGGT